MISTLHLVEFQLDIYVVYSVTSSSEIQGPCTANINVFGLFKVRNQITSFLYVTCVLTLKRKWLCIFFLNCHIFKQCQLLSKLLSMESRKTF